MAPEYCRMDGSVLWFSPQQNGYYWQDGNGVGPKTSKIYPSRDSAVKAMLKGTVRFK